MENLERIELPSQLIAALSDPLLQKHLLLKDDKSSQRRIDQWLAIFLDSQLEMEESGEPATKELRDVLDRLLLYTRSSKVKPTLLEEGR